MKVQMTILVGFSFAIVVGTTAGMNVSHAVMRVFSFNDLFPASQHEPMGLHKLTDMEKEALRDHVERLLVSVAAGSETPKPVQPARPTAGGYFSTGGGHWVQQNIDSGAFILLEDGSLWQIDSLEKLDAMLWLPLDNITVIESSRGSLGYNYLLINTDSGEKAHAKYVGRQ